MISVRRLGIALGSLVAAALVMGLVGGLVLNHVASAIHAGRTAVKQGVTDHKVSPQPWAVSVQPADKTGGLRVNFTRTF